VRVIAVREHLTRAMHQAVKPPRDTHRESLQATGEPHLIWRLDDEVKMVPLHREMHKAEAAPIAAALERFAQQTEASGSTAHRSADGWIFRVPGADELLTFIGRLGATRLYDQFLTAAGSASS
jgi:hypothetical protein